MLLPSSDLKDMSLEELLEQEMDETYPGPGPISSVASSAVAVGQVLAGGEAPKTSESESTTAAVVQVVHAGGEASKTRESGCAGQHEGETGKTTTVEDHKDADAEQASASPKRQESRAAAVEQVLAEGESSKTSQSVSATAAVVPVVHAGGESSKTSESEGGPTLGGCAGEHEGETAKTTRLEDHKNADAEQESTETKTQELESSYAAVEQVLAGGEASKTSESEGGPTLDGFAGEHKAETAKATTVEDHKDADAKQASASTKAQTEESSYAAVEQVLAGGESSKTSESESSTAAVGQVVHAGGEASKTSESEGGPTLDGCAGEHEGETSKTTRLEDHKNADAEQESTETKTQELESGVGVGQNPAAEEQDVTFDGGEQTTPKIRADNNEEQKRLMDLLSEVRQHPSFRDFEVYCRKEEGIGPTDLWSFPGDENDPCQDLLEFNDFLKQRGEQKLDMRFIEFEESEETKMDVQEETMMVETSKKKEPLYTLGITPKGHGQKIIQTMTNIFEVRKPAAEHDEASSLSSYDEGEVSEWVKDARKHRLFHSYVAFIHEECGCDDFDWSFGKEEALEDLQDFNNFLVRHDDVPLGWAPPSDMLFVKEVSQLVQEARNHKLFESFIHHQIALHKMPKVSWLCHCLEQSGLVSAREFLVKYNLIIVCGLPPPDMIYAKLMTIYFLFHVF